MQGLYVWTCSLYFVQAVDGDKEGKAVSEGGTEVTVASKDGVLDLEEGLQDELCKLWDMSMNQVKRLCGLRNIILGYLW